MAAVDQSPSVAGAKLLAHWPLLLGGGVLAVPTLVSLGRQVWSTEAGAHGPIVLATGVWLFWQRTNDFERHGTRGADWLAAIAVFAALGLYVFGRAYDFISLETAGLYGVFLSSLYSYFGLRALLRNWFPLLYLGFLVPPPGWVIDQATAPLKEFVSFAATRILEMLGVPIIREGVTMFVAQYQLLVEDACSGMNSIVGLASISLFYIYLLRNASWRYSAALVMMVIPIAIIANIIRIIILVLLTYFFGDGVAQGFLHTAAGVMLFATALAMVMGVDHLMSLVLKPRRGAA